MVDSQQLEVTTTGGCFKKLLIKPLYAACIVKQKTDKLSIKVGEASPTPSKLARQYFFSVELDTPTATRSTNV